MLIVWVPTAILVKSLYINRLENAVIVGLLMIIKNKILKPRNSL